MKKSEKKRMPSVDYRGAIKSMDEQEFEKFCVEMKIKNPTHFKYMGTRKRHVADNIASGYYVLRNEPAKFDSFDDAVWNALRKSMGDYKTVDYMFYNLSL